MIWRGEAAEALQTSLDAVLHLFADTGERLPDVGRAGGRAPAAGGCRDAAAGMEESRRPGAAAAGGAGRRRPAG